MPHGNEAHDGQGELARLMIRCGQGDEAAFRRVYDLQSAALYGIALRITKQPALAMDAMQDALVQAWRNGHRFDPGRGSAEAWLRGLLRHRAIDILHRHGRKTPAWEELEDVKADPGKDLLSRLEAKQDGRHLKRCLEKIEPARQRLIVLAYADGMSHAEIAERTGQPLGTVKSTIRRALLALKACLGGEP